MGDTEEHQSHPSLKIPTNQDVRIWRYMDLTKYLAILQRQSLFFTRATLLQSADPFEGSFPKLMVAELQEWSRNVNSSNPEFHEALGKAYKYLVKTYLISCWHMNEHESAAMWRLYLRSNEGVCIQSTYRRLRSSLPKCVFIGEVEYLDYDTERFAPPGTLDTFDLIMHKRKSFEHERELRAIFWDIDVPEAQIYKPKIEAAGLWIPVDLSSLIERVYINPTAEPWIATVIREVTAKYELRADVVQSALSESPLSLY